MLVHGSLTTGPVEWAAQRPLADEGYQLVVPTRRAYTPQSGGVGEDFAIDGEDVAALLRDGAHLVGHSYGALVAMVADPEIVRLTRMGDLDMAKPASGLAAMLKKLKPKPSGKGGAGASHMRMLRRLPRTGDRIVFGGWRFEVVAMEGRRVSRVSAEPEPAAEG